MLSAPSLVWEMPWLSLFSRTRLPALLVLVLLVVVVVVVVMKEKEWGFPGTTYLTGMG